MAAEEGRKESPITCDGNGKRLRSDDEQAKKEQLPSSPNISTNSTTKKRVLSLLDLPDECIAMVLNAFSRYPFELAKIMNVCKRFYEICSSSPRLWQCADLSFCTEGSKQWSKILDPENVKRRELLAQFLVKRKAKLTDLRLFCDLSNEFQSARNLIWNCCSKELTHIDFHWIEWKGPKRYDACEEERLTQCFREVFERLSASCPDISLLFIQLDGSCATARMLGSRLTNIVQLYVQFAFIKLDNEMSSADPCAGPIEIILFYLRKLQIFKLHVDLAVVDGFDGYVLKSDSLKHFDFSASYNLLIKEMRLPQLHTIVAFKVCSFPQGHVCRCLFEVIEEGCPSLTRINNYRNSTSPGLQSFSLTNREKINMRICNCNNHNFIVHNMLQRRAANEM